MLAEAIGIEARGKAEADGLDKKAEAMLKMNQAAVLEMYFEALPKVAESIAKPLAQVDKITMYGDGNTAKMTEDITKSITQVNAGLGDSLGLDLKTLFNNLVGAKLVAPTISDAVSDGLVDAKVKELDNDISE